MTVERHRRTGLHCFLQATTLWRPTFHENPGLAFRSCPFLRLGCVFPEDAVIEHVYSTKTPVRRGIPSTSSPAVLTEETFFMHWIIAYDIHADRRRARVARRLERAGLRVQQSVFLVEESSPQIHDLLHELSRLIAKSTDRVAAWPLQANWIAAFEEVGLSSGPVHEPTVIW